MNGVTNAENMLRNYVDVCFHREQGRICQMFAMSSLDFRPKIACPSEPLSEASPTEFNGKDYVLSRNSSMSAYVNMLTHRDIRGALVHSAVEQTRNR